MQQESAPTQPARSLSQRPLLLLALLGAFASACHDGPPSAPADPDSGLAVPDLVDDGAAPDDSASPVDIFIPDVPPADTTPRDTAIGDDTDPGVCNTVGCPCASNGECLDGLCIEGLDGGVCTRPCITECPAGFDCLLSTSFGADPISICVPQHTRLCRPCRANEECQSGNDPFPAYCVPAENPADGSFCASSCAARGCPDGYSCETVDLGDGGTARQCMAIGGACECRPSWADFGYSTDCSVVNAFGSCSGNRFCSEDGLSACEGRLAAPEICDGEDNDCNGTPDDITAFPCPISNAFGTCQGVTVCQAGSSDPVCSGREASAELCNGIDDNCNSATDEAGCDDGLSCTNDVCIAAGNCQHTLAVGSCLIAGGCWSNNQFNPSNSCQQCNTTQSTTAWTQAPNTCIIGGQCFPNGAVNPDNGCQVCNANQSNSTWTTSTNTCTVGGQCYLANESNPANSCQLCVPFSSTTAWTQAANTCNIQGQCYAAGARRPGQPCFVCDPTRNATGWSAALSGTSCNDGNACSTGETCNGAGACVGDTSCNDGIACTKNICTPSGCDNSQVEDNWCRINGTCVTQGFQNPANQCQACLPTTTQASRTVWSNRPSTAICNDGNACTLEDKCNGSGTCVAGSPKNCSDGLSCTNDTCNASTGVCSSALVNGNCLISGTCYTNNTTQPNNVCRRCATASSTSAWSLNNGATCNDNNVCTSNDTCNNNVCAGTVVLDSFDTAARNESVGTASFLSTIADSDGLDDLKQFSATLHPDSDIDWYRYKINDNNNVWNPRPHVRLLDIAPNSNYDLCVYWKCDDPGSGQSIDCEEGSSTPSSGSGLLLSGYEVCCSRNSGTTGETVQFQTTCRNGLVRDETGTAWIRVFKVSGTATSSCNTPYRVQWGNR